MSIITNLYTPAEAEVATGRSVENSRNDRRAGFDAAVEGHARYDVIGLARSCTRQQFANFGIGPKRSLPFLDQAANIVAWHLISLRAVWSDRALRAYEPRRSSFEVDPNASPYGAVVGRYQRLGAAIGEYFSQESAPKALVDKLGYPTPEAFTGILGGVVIWPTQEVDFCEDVLKEVGYLSPFDQRASGPVVVLPLQWVARGMASKLPRPLFDIDDAGEA